MSDIIKAATPSFLLLMFFAPIIYGLYLRRINKLTTDRLCVLILVCGAVLRLMYISYTDEFIRQHDLGRFYEEKNNYHSGYMLYLLENLHLPDFDPRDRWQFYHPPLHHIICASVLGLLKALGIDHISKGPGVLQWLTASYSVLFCVFASKTMKLLGIKDKALSLATAVVTFHPTLIILAGSLNNDMLSALFSMLAVYFTVRWQKNRKWYDILGIAFSVGLGMMTKLTVGLLAPAIAVLFLIVLIKKRMEWKTLVPQFVLFGAVCIPLGMFWPVRNLIKFGVPFNYVPGLSENSGQYIDTPVVKRLFDYSIHQFSSPFTQWEWNGDSYNEYNPVIALLKNAMFDEDPFFSKSLTLQSFCTALFFAGAVVAVLSVLALIVMWSKHVKLDVELKLLLTIIYAVIFGNYIIFCINYPQVCTENMRYCVPLIFAGSAALGLMIGRFEESGNYTEKRICKTAAVSMTALPLLSTFVYAAMMFYEMAVN